MKCFSKIAVLMVCAGAVAHAGTITFASQGTAADANEWTAIGDSLAIVPHDNWVAALPGSSWVSYAPTGKPFTAGFTFTPNNFVLSFFEALMLPEAPLAATVTYRADDSAALYINNVLVQPEAPQSGNTYSTCSDFAVGCLQKTELTLDIAAYLVAGTNTLRFDVAQRAGWSFGLNYSGSVHYIDRDEVEETPEPATLSLMGAVLIGAGLWRRSRA